MLINSAELKYELKNQEQHTNNDIVERCFNMGIDTAIKIIEMMEKTEAIYQEDRSRNPKDIHPVHPDNK